MRTTLPTLALLLATAACQAPTTAPSANETSNDAAAPAAPAAPEAPPAPAPSEVATNANEPPPVHLDPDAPPVPGDNTAAGAARRVLEYCDALATRRFGDAYAMWGDGGKASGHTLAEFTHLFDKAKVSDCQIGAAGEMQGAAGSIYIEVQNVFRGQYASGKRFAIEGPVVLRRVNDVDGSTAEQRRWHIARAEFPLGS